MPVAHFHLPRGRFTSDQERRLLIEASETYARVLDSPIARVRTFLIHYEPTCLAVGGRIVDEGGTVAPYFTAIVLAGRRVEQRQELLLGLTDLIAEVLEIAHGPIRGQIIEVEPENWGIAGTPASQARSAEFAPPAIHTA